MEKHSVNLLIRKVNEPAYIARARIYLPILAVVSLILFIISFLASIIYINNNNQEFNALNTRVENLQRKIAANKSNEGIYSLTFDRVKILDQLGGESKNYTKLLTEILKLSSPGISISQMGVDKKNSVNGAIAASSSAELDDFVTVLQKADAGKLFSAIKSSGIVRDKGGGYLFTISFIPDKSLLL